MIKNIILHTHALVSENKLKHKIKKKTEFINEKKYIPADNRKILIAFLNSLHKLC